MNRSKISEETFKYFCQDKLNIINDIHKYYADADGNYYLSELILQLILIANIPPGKKA